MATNRLVTLLPYVAANIRTLRLARGWTQQRLAEQADVDLRHLQRIERANVNLTVAALVALADSLAVEPGHLFVPADLRPARPGRPRQIAKGPIRRRRRSAA